MNTTRRTRRNAAKRIQSAARKYITSRIRRQNTRPYVTRCLGMTNKKTYNFTRHIHSVGGTGSTSDSGIELNRNATYLIGSSGFSGMEFKFQLLGVTATCGGTTAWNGGAIWNMPDITDLLNLFDMYRINYIDVTIRFSQDSSSESAPTVCIPLLYVVEDQNDAATLSLNQVQEYGNVQILQLSQADMINKKNKYRLNPRVQRSVQITGGAGIFETPEKPIWLSTSGNGDIVDHFGMKMVFDPIHYGAALALGYVHFDFEYNLSFKNLN